MRKIFFAAAFCFCLHGFSQNAFYDTQSLLDWYRLPDADTTKIKKAKGVLSMLLYYAGGTNRLLKDTAANIMVFRLYQKADSLYSFAVRKTLSSTTVVDKIDTGRKIPIVLQPLKSKHLALRVDSAALMASISRYRKAYNDTANTQPVITSAIALVEALRQAGTTRDVVLQTVSDTLVLTAFQQNFDSAASTVKALADMAEQKLQDGLDSTKKQIYVTTMNLPPDEFRRLFSQINIQAATGKDVQVNLADNATIAAFQQSQLVVPNQFALSTQSGNQLVSAPNLIDLNFPTQSDIIDGIAIYLARRTKQEAALLFIESLNRAIGSNQLAQDLFPQTWAVMQEMDAYSSPRFGAKWRNAIATDYIALPQNIASSPYIEKRLPNPELYNCFRDAVTFSAYVGKKYSFPDIVRLLYNDHSKLKGKWTSIGIDVLHILNNELRDTTRNAYNWISPGRFVSLSQEELFCLHDLVRLKYRDRVCTPLRDMLDRTDSLRTQAHRYQLFYTELLTMLKQFNDLQTAFAKKSADGTVMAADGFWDAQRTFLDFLLDKGSIVQLTDKERKGIELCKSTFFTYDYLSNKNYVAAADQVLNIVSALLNKSTRELVNLSPQQVAFLKKSKTSLYESVQALNRQFADMITLQQIARWLNEPPADTALRLPYIRENCTVNDPALLTRIATAAGVDSAKLRAVRAEFEDKISRSYKSVKEELNKQIKDRRIYLFKNAGELKAGSLAAALDIVAKENDTYFKWLSDFAGLLTEVSATKKSDELANVIESYAMPPGSYRLKRNATFSIDLNAFTGFYLGGEKIQGQNKWGAVYGFTAPVGFAFSWGLSRAKSANDAADGSVYVSGRGLLKKRTQHSLTLDVSVVDLGAVVSYRFSGETKGLPNNVSWDQVLSLGANFRWGIKSTPFCIGVGVQRSPKLRTINDVQKDAWRAHLSAAFDLPLVNIYRSR